MTSKRRSSRNTHDRTFHVYVIRLSEEVLKRRKFRKANPNYVEGRPCVYVGMTGWTPERRFEAHLNGYKSSSYVTKYGCELMQQIYDALNPLTYDEAVEEEKRLAGRLRRLGFAVWQN
jgi:hypothetical protein